jgi:hypothetical protein
MWFGLPSPKFCEMDAFGNFSLKQGEVFISYWGMESYPLDIHAPLKAVSPCVDRGVVRSHAPFVNAGYESEPH